MIPIGFGFGYSQFRITCNSQSIRGGDGVRLVGGGGVRGVGDTKALCQALCQNKQLLHPHVLLPCDAWAILPR